MPALRVVMPVKVFVPESVQMVEPLLSMLPLPLTTPEMLPVPVLEASKVSVFAPSETALKKVRLPVLVGLHVWLPPRASVETLKVWLVALALVMPALLLTVSVAEPLML